jgi:hypothetical protein
MKLALSFGLIAILVALAGEPPQNTIPTIGIRIGRNLYPELEDVTLEHVILLSWRYLDGIDSWGWAAVASTDSVASWCDSIGALFVFSPAEMGSFAEPSEPNGLWFRWDSFPDVTSQYAFAKPDPDGWDNVYAFMDGPTFYDSLPLPFMQSLHDSTSSYPAYWFFSPWDEGNTNQRARMVTADTSEDFGEFYGYWPDMYTQARSEVDSTPTMEEIDPEGVFS